MIIFRPHRGSLAEAMAEAKEFASVEEMKEYIVKVWHDYWAGSKILFSVEDIVINDDSEVNDERIGWEDSKYVCVKRMGNEDYVKKYGKPQCIGMCATKYRKNY